MAIRTFRHNGLKGFFETGNNAGIQPSHAKKLERLLARLDKASGAEDMNLPGWDLHRLKGKLAGHWSVQVNGNWRLIFSFDAHGDAILVDYLDYH